MSEAYASDCVTVIKILTRGSRATLSKYMLCLEAGVGRAKRRRTPTSNRNFKNKYKK